MKNIQALRVGNVVNLSIDGKLHKKNCGSAKEADELFKVILKAKANPTDENIKAIRILLNERTRVAMEAGLESCLETGEVFMAGFNTPIPDTLVSVIKDYNENGYPIDAIINFWKLLMINPDKRVRADLFDFIQTHDFVLTDTGYMLVYKAVKYKTKEENDVAEFVTNQYLHVKQDWKCSPNKYVVYRNAEGVLGITKRETANAWTDKKDVEILGNLGDLNTELDKLSAESQTVYTDMHTGTFTIKLGVPVKMERKDCNSDPKVDCSYGLHVGATKYVEIFGSGENKAVLVCLVNPAHVVAVPNNDHSKMRVSEYFPIALATYDDSTKKISIVEQKYFENDYKTYEEEELEKMIASIQANELPIQKAKNVPEDETRPLSELQRIIESRLIDIF